MSYICVFVVIPGQCNFYEVFVTLLQFPILHTFDLTQYCLADFTVGFLFTYLLAGV